MARKRRVAPTAPVTRQGPLGPVTENTDGTVDLTIDPQKFHDYALKQHERVLGDIRAAKASGMFPVGMMDELEKHAVDAHEKLKARPPQPGHKSLELRLTR
jgi:hypothetical protein